MLFSDQVQSLQSLHKHDIINYIFPYIKIAILRHYYA